MVLNYTVLDVDPLFVYAGWHENMEEKNREVAMAPVVEGGMTR